MLFHYHQVCLVFEELTAVSFITVPLQVMNLLTVFKCFSLSLAFSIFTMFHLDVGFVTLFIFHFYLFCFIILYLSNLELSQLHICSLIAFIIFGKFSATSLSLSPFSSSFSFSSSEIPIICILYHLLLSHSS